MLTRQIGTGGGLPVDSSSVKLSISHRGLFESISKAIKTISEDEKESDSLRTDSLQRLRGVFYKGATKYLVKQIIESMMQIGIANNLWRSNCAKLLNKCCNMDIKTSGESFSSILNDYVLKDYQDNIELIKSSDYAGGAYDIALLYTELLVCFNHTEGRNIEAIVNMTKRLLVVLLGNKIGSLKCLVNILKMCGHILYKGESLFGIEDVSMDKVFDRIKEIIVTKENTDRCTRRLLMDVIEIRAEQWNDVWQMDHELPLTKNYAGETLQCLVNDNVADSLNEESSLENVNPLAYITEKQFLSLHDNYFSGDVASGADINNFLSDDEYEFLYNECIN